MPPKGMKRPAAAIKGNAKKRPADANAAKCAEVAAELGSAEALPQDCRAMLAKMIQSCLVVYAAERHDFQKKIVAMAAETLSGTKAKLQKAIPAAQAKVDGADAEKASRTANAEAAAAKVTQLSSALDNAKETASADVSAEKAARAHLADAEAAIKATEVELATVGDKKAKLETTMKDVYEPAKAAGAQGRSVVSSLEKVLKEFGLEANLVSSLADCLKKEVGARNTFDGVVLGEAEKFMAQCIAEMEQTIKGGDNTKAANASAKAVAETACAAAAEKAAASKEALAAAKVAKSEGEAASAAAKASLLSYDSDMRAANTTLADAKDGLASFLEGPFKSFEELKDLAPPPPPPEPQAEVAAAAEASA